MSVQSPASTVRILVVDDERDMVATLHDLLCGEGYHVDVAFNGEDAIEQLERDSYDLVLTDLAMPGIDGSELLAQVKTRNSDTEVVVITGYGTINSAVDSIRQGALNYLIKPVEPQDILSNVETVIRRLQNRDIDHNQQRFYDLIGKTPAMHRIFKLIPRVARMHGSVLIQGESGVGKELVAHAIHHSSRRNGKRFVAIDCGALTDSLLESELFGHKQGAYTGATAERVGLIETAHEGTLFLDEVGNSSPYLQSRLLRVIEEKKVRRVGDNNLRSVDVRIVAASNENLKHLVEQGLFRSDLYYRLCGFVIDIPPLRERKDDIPLLVNYFADQNANEFQEPIKSFPPDVVDYLMQYNWPGNIRELRIVVDRAIALSESERVEKKHIIIDQPILNPIEESSQVYDENILTTPFYSAVESYERKYLSQLLDRVDGNISHASQLSGASRKTIREKGKKYGLL